MNTLIESELLDLLRKYCHTHTYNFKDDEGSDYVLNTFLETNYNDSIGFIGELSTIGYAPELCLGKYTHSNGEINSLSVIYCSDDSANPRFEFYNRQSGNDFLFYNYVEYAEKRTTQPTLYTHTLTLTAGATNYVLMYDCTDGNVVNNIQRLRTIMKVSSASDNVNLPVVNPTDLSTAGLQVTTSICKIGTENVTAVTDRVTQKL